LNRDGSLGQAGTYVVARTDRIGDLILSLPVAEAIKASRPGAHVHYVVSPKTAELARACPFIDGVIRFDETDRDPRSLFELLRCLRQIRADVAVVLRPTLRIGLACLLAGIPRRVGTSYRYYSLAFTARVREHRRFADKHELDYNLNVLRAAVDVEDRPYLPCIEVPIPYRDRAAEVLRKKDLTERDFVIIHPGSGGSARNLPLKVYARVADLIEGELGIKVLVTGGKDESAVVDELDSARSEPSRRLTGIPSLMELAAVIRLCRLFISGSTGPMHMAAAVGVPTLSFFSPVRSCSPRRWGPIGHTNVIVTPPVPECPTCRGTACEYFDCMNLIPLNRIEEALNRLLR
jgi:heptosyltransferase-3